MRMSGVRGLKTSRPRCSQADKEEPIMSNQLLVFYTLIEQAASFWRAYNKLSVALLLPDWIRASSMQFGLILKSTL